MSGQELTNKRFTKDRMLLVMMDNKSFILLIVIAIVAAIVSGGIFLRMENIASIFRQFSLTSILALGYVFVLTAGMIDLSVGHMLSLCAVIYAFVSFVAPVPVAILAAVATGLACGWVNGLLSIKLNLLPFILTLGMAQVFRCAAYVVSGGISYTVKDPAMKFIGQWSVEGFPIISMPLIIVIVVAVVVAVVVYRTKFGRHVVATGGNMEAARVSGVDTAKTKICCFVIMGLMVAIASVVLTGRVGIIQPNGGEGMEMDAISAVIIGGTSLAGGKANVLGAVLGALMLSVISNLLNLAGLDSFWQFGTKGLIIVLAILLDSVTESFFRKSQISA